MGLDPTEQFHRSFKVFEAMGSGASKKYEAKTP